MVIKMKMNLTLKDVGLVLIGCFLLALSVNTFILPFNILSGGVAGIGVALEPLLGINPRVTIDVLMIGMFILGALFLGKEFAFKTFISSLAYPGFLFLLSFLNLSIEGMTPLVASLFGGLLGGIGMGIVLRAKASTGGMSIPPLILHKYTKIALPTLILLIDAITVLLGIRSHGIYSVLIGFISIWAAAFMINKVLLYGGKRAKSVQIISEHTEAINKAIHQKLKRGTTILHAQGGFTKEEKQVLLVVIMNTQYLELTELVSEIDPLAFLIVQEATEVKGEGFSFGYRV